MIAPATYPHQHGSLFWEASKVAGTLFAWLVADLIICLGLSRKQDFWEKTVSDLNGDPSIAYVITAILFFSAQVWIGRVVFTTLVFPDALTLAGLATFCGSAYALKKGAMVLMKPSQPLQPNAPVTNVTNAPNADVVVTPASKP